MAAHGTNTVHSYRAVMAVHDQRTGTKIRHPSYKHGAKVFYGNAGVWSQVLARQPYWVNQLVGMQARRWIGGNWTL